MRYRVVVECAYTARFDVLVDDDSEAMARIRAAQAAQMQDFEWSDYSGPTARVVESTQEATHEGVDDQAAVGGMHLHPRQGH